MSRTGSQSEARPTSGNSLSAARTQALGGSIGRLGNRFHRAAAAAAVGGTVTGTSSKAFNDELHDRATEAVEAKLTPTPRELARQGKVREF